MNYSNVFLARMDQNKNSYMHFLAFYLPHHSGLCVCYTMPVIYRNCLYLILACVAKNGTCAWIIPLFFGQNRPKQEQLRVFSCILTPTWFWLVRLHIPCRLYTRTPKTWFWLVWPKTGLVHELFQHFFGLNCQTKNSYIWFWLYVCCTSASYIQEQYSELCVCYTMQCCYSLYIQ